MLPSTLDKGGAHLDLAFEILANISANKFDENSLEDAFKKIYLTWSLDFSSFVSLILKM